MTKDISSPISNSEIRISKSESSLPPGPAGAKPEPFEKEFASVIEQAMKRKVPARQATGARERGSERVREREITGVREKLRDGGHSPVAADVRRRNVDKTGSSTSAQRGLAESTPDDADEKVDEVETSASSLQLMREGAASDAEEALDDVDLESEEPESEAPSNIIAFPGLAIAQSVIIPFPLAAAKAMSSVMGEGEGNSELAVLGEGEGDSNSANSEFGIRNSELVAVPEGKILQLPIASSAKSTIVVGTAETGTGGVDYRKLGLELVEQVEVEIDLPAAFIEKLSQIRNSEFGIRNSNNEVEPQLPDNPDLPEDSAHPDETGLAGIEGDSLPPEATQAPVHNGFPNIKNPVPAAGASAGIIAGTSAAKQESRMESLSNSARESAPTEGAAHALEEFQSAASEPLPDESAASDLSARNLVATEWQMGRPVSNVDRPAPNSSSDSSVDAAATVERISKLMMTETALVRKHGSDAMAVVLRPDAETELFVHFTQRNGQVEATIRCERGDAQHLSALWPQLQESLAQQKVRLAPLQDAPSNHSNFNQSAGSDQRGGENGSPRQSPREKRFMDEWPAPASSEPGARGARGDGGSRHRRVTTSRPGWETWA